MSAGLRSVAALPGPCYPAGEYASYVRSNGVRLVRGGADVPAAADRARQPPKTVSRREVNEEIRNIRKREKRVAISFLLS